MNVSKNINSLECTDTYVSAAKFAVLGSPIEHSLSPILFQAAFKHYGLNYSYERIEVAEKDFAQFITSRDDMWRGFSVTMPDKIAALNIAAVCTERARSVGAANTLYRGSDQQWCADNTDIYGLQAGISISGLTPGSASVPIVIVGAGGTARAAIAAAVSYTREIVIAIRTPAKAGDLVEIAKKYSANCRVVNLNDPELSSICSSSSMVISTVPDQAASEYASRLTQAPRVFDVLYKPWPTELIKQALSGNKIVVGGLTMLLYQACKQFALFTRRDPPLQAMAEALSKHTGIPIDNYECFTEI